MDVLRPVKLKKNSGSNNSATVKSLNPVVAICQLKVTDNKTHNLKNAQKMIEDSALQKADIIVLPEMFNCPYDSSCFSRFSEKYPGETGSLLSMLAALHSVYIIGGSTPERDGRSIYNTSYSFDREGTLIGKYRKIHLFDVEIEGGIRFKESETITAGRDTTVIETEFCKIGIAICYDMRFPELIRKMVLSGVEIIIVPAAFNMTTGPAHWHLLARTRALDNQVYFIAASPARDEEAFYVAYGHSLIADPWGRIISEASVNEEVIFSEIDLDFVDKIRRELPLLKHRREEVYKAK
jgi:omega-amidase